MAERIQGFALLNVFAKIVFQKNASKKLGAFFMSFFVISGYDPVSLSECMGNGEWEMGNGRGRLFALFVPKDFRVERHETVRRET